MTTNTTAPPVRESPVIRRGARRWWWTALALAVLVGAAAASLAIGTKNIPIATVWDVLFGHGSGEDHLVIHTLRVPRTLAGLVVGAALGAAGALIQALTRNPLADPGVLGVNAGAALFVAIAVGVLGVQAASGYVWFAFAGALVTTVVIYLIGSAGARPADPVRVLLAGVALSAVLTGITSGLTLLDPDTFDQLRNWQAGAVANRGFDVLLPCLPLLLVGFVLAVVVTRPLNSMALGDERAASLGVTLARTRVAVVLAVTVLAGAATAIAGPIAFLGLMSPHIARWFVGADQRWLVPGSALLAAILLLVSDVLARVVMTPGEIPVGIVTSFVGAPVLIVLIRRRNARAL